MTSPGEQPNEALQSLARAHGVAIDFWNFDGHHQIVTRETITAVLRALGVAEAYNPAQFRESRDARGDLQFLSHDKEAELLAGLPVVDVTVPRK